MAGAIVPGGCADRCVQERGWKHGVVRVRVCGQKKSHNSDEAWFRVEVSVSRGLLIGPLQRSYMHHYLTFAAGVFIDPCDPWIVLRQQWNFRGTRFPRVTRRHGGRKQKQKEPHRGVRAPYLL